jgi:hypothetical protein
VVQILPGGWKIQECCYLKIEAIFSYETSVLARTTRCNISEDIQHCCRRENIPEDSVLRPYKLQLFAYYYGLLVYLISKRRPRTMCESIALWFFGFKISRKVIANA